MRIGRRIFLPSLCAAFVTDAATPALPTTGSEFCVQKFLIPEYPNIARKLFIQGEVTAKVHILGNGSVESVAATGGHKLLQGSVEWALKRWEFRVPDQSETDLTLTFAFVLDKDESEACIFQVSGVFPSRFEIRINYGPRMESDR
jgi:TonB family protein